MRTEARDMAAFIQFGAISPLYPPLFYGLELKRFTPSACHSAWLPTAA